MNNYPSGILMMITNTKTNYKLKIGFEETNQQIIVSLFLYT